MDHKNRTAEAQDALWRQYVEEVRQNPDRPFEHQWASFQRIFADRSSADGPPIVWRPEEKQLKESNIARLMADLGFGSYTELYNWSIQERESFWDEVLNRLGIVFAKPPDSILDLTTGVKHPRWLPGAALNIVDSCFTAPADKPAIVQGGETPSARQVVTYGELEALVNRFANGLRERGFKPDDAIALYMPMNIACIVAYLGIIRAGCRVVSIADSFSPSEVKTRMEIAAAAAILTVERYIRAGRPIDMYDKVREADAAQVIVIPARDRDTNRDLDLRGEDMLWDDLLSSSDSCASVTGAPDRATNILFSSGTTGVPKAIPWTHLTPLKAAMDGYFHQDIHPQDVVAWPTNIGWMMGPWLIYATMLNNATMALYEGAPLGDGFTRFVQKAQVTIFGVVPSLVRVWRTTDATAGADWNRIRLFSSTGEPSNREDYLWLMSRNGYRAPVIEYLGGTEIGGGHLAGTVVQPASPATFTTPALGTAFVILDEENNPISDGEMGELYLIPPAIGLSQTILNKDHEEVYYADCPVGPHGETLRRHGDHIGQLPHGFYRAQGRADDTMNLGGIKVSSVELERIIDHHDAVYESAAIAVQPGGEGADMLVVFAVLREKMDRQTLTKELQGMIGKRLNPLFKIYDLVIVDTLPRTASNKLMRRTLRTQYGETLKGSRGPGAEGSRV